MKISVSKGKQNKIHISCDGEYMFTVDVFTATNAKIANLYLIDENNEVYSSINNHLMQFNYTEVSITLI